MRRFVLCAAVAAMPLFAAADTPPALDSKAFGPPDRVLFWTPEQQRASYPNMDRIFLTREISRGDPQTHPAYPLPVALEDLSLKLRKARTEYEQLRSALDNLGISFF